MKTIHEKRFFVAGFAAGMFVMLALAMALTSPRRIVVNFPPEGVPEGRVQSSDRSRGALPAGGWGRDPGQHVAGL